MTSRYGLALVLGLVVVSGCSDSFNAGTINYTPNNELFTKLKNEDGTPKARLQQRVEDSLAKVFGPRPQEMIVPKGSGLPEGGARLADLVVRAGIDKTPVTLAYDVKTTSPAWPRPDRENMEGGYSLYRKHCLHCHGVSGDGNGPTAAFLWPRPRDYRKGVYKFTSTTGQKPTRHDLRRILNQGIANSSMPAFEALMTEPEIEQVIDYVIFLSSRGETERRLIEEATVEEEPKDDKEESAINEEKALEVAQGVFEAWNLADTEVLNPPIPRTPSTPESIKNGKLLFLGLGQPKLECAGCHGPQAKGNGPSFVPYSMFREVVFGGDPAEQDERLIAYVDREAERAAMNAEQDPAFSQVVTQSLDVAQKSPDYLASILKSLPADHDPGYPSVVSQALAEAQSKIAEAKANGKADSVSRESVLESIAKTISVSRENVEAFKIAEIMSARVATLNRDWTGGSLDDWGNPLRPANINNGPATQYKGGRRPLDIYWRIAKGINGAKMPAHAQLLKPEQIWDLVNFVLAMPYNPDLMDDAPETVPAASTAATAMAAPKSSNQ